MAVVAVAGRRWTCCWRRWRRCTWRRRWREPHQCQTGDIPFIRIPFSRIPFICIDERAWQSNYGRPHSGEQFRRPKDAVQFNRKRNAQREPKPQIQRRAQHVELPLGRRRIAQYERITQSEQPRPHHRTAATAGWHDGRDGGNGWWRHGNGGYGWVGPLYWPFAYYDMYDYAMWGDGYDDSFWGYGYGDIYAGIFAPYGYDDLTGYLPQYASSNPSETAPASGAPAAATDQLTQMCGEDSRDIAGLPIDQFQQAIQPTDEQSAALDDLANASLKAAQDIKAACPTDIALTAPSRLAAMQQRIEAMIAAVQTVQPPLEKFYGLLSDEQKARLTALGNDQRQSNGPPTTTGSLVQNCGAAQPGVMEWPTAEIDQTVRPTDAQRASLVALQNATAQAADLLKASCLTERSAHAAGAARGGRQATRHHAASGQVGEFGAQRLLWNAVRRAEGEVRSDRSAADGPARVAGGCAHRSPQAPARHSQPRANHPAVAGSRRTGWWRVRSNAPGRRL